MRTAGLRSRSRRSLAQRCRQPRAAAAATLWRRRRLRARAPGLRSRRGRWAWGTTARAAPRSAPARPPRPPAPQARPRPAKRRCAPAGPARAPSFAIGSDTFAPFRPPAARRPAWSAVSQHPHAAAARAPPARRWLARCRSWGACAGRAGGRRLAGHAHGGAAAARGWHGRAAPAGQPVPAHRAAAAALQPAEDPDRAAGALHAPALRCSPNRQGGPAWRR